MKDWQVNYVNKTLGGLVEKTIWNSNLKCCLIEKDLISTEEGQQLTATCTNKGSIAAAFDLYEIIKTREHGYLSLMEALKASLQTDAFNILNLGLVDGRAQDFLDLNIDIFGTTGTIKDVFNSVTLHEVKELFKCEQIQKDYESISNSDVKKLRLDGNLPQPRPLYISRSISNRVVLDPKVFRMSCNDVFVFKGLSRMELVKLVGTNIQRSSESQLLKITCRHIYLEDEGDWDDLVEISEAPLHLISMERRTVIEDSIVEAGESEMMMWEESDEELNFEGDWDTADVDYSDIEDMDENNGIEQNTIHDTRHLEDQFVLLRSTKVTSVLLENRIGRKNSDDAYISEEKFVDSLINKTDSIGACLCDIPGMGKTWLFESLARALSRKSQGRGIILYFQLSQFSEYLASLTVLPNMEEDVLKTILCYAFESKLASYLLWRYAKERTCKFYLFLDGFDEVHGSRVVMTTQFLQILKSCCFESVMVIISSRPHMRSVLEETFGVIAYDILPLSREEQVGCLITHWHLYNKGSDNEKLVELARHCIETCKKLQQNKDKDILGVPLKCHILAVLYERHAKKFCSQTRRKSYPLGDTLQLNSICDLYDKFLEHGLEKAESKWSKTQSVSFDWKQQLNSFVTWEALKLLFPDIAVEYSKSLNLNFIAQIATDNESFRLGILVLNNSRFSFVHRTFAEYVAGKFFAEFWTEDDSQEDNLFETMGLLFVKHVMRTTRKGSKWLSVLNENWRKQKIHTYHFAHTSILYFLNSVLEHKRTQVKIEATLEHFKQVVLSESTTEKIRGNFQIVASREISQHEYLNIHLWHNIYFVLLCCLEDGFTYVLGWLTSFIKKFVPNDDLPKLLIVSKDSFKNAQEDWITSNQQVASLAFLLYNVALKASPECALTIFKLFENSEDNPFITFCNPYPVGVLSPLEVAIDRNDVDMTVFFLDKVSIPPERLLVRCILGENLTKVNTVARRRIFEEAYSTGMLSKICIQALSDVIVNLPYDDKLNVDFGKMFFPKCGIHLKALSIQCKAKFLEKAFEICEDCELFEILLLLFEKNFENIPYEANRPTNNHTFEDVIHCLDIPNARKVFNVLMVNEDFCFQNVRQVQILKALCSICVDFSRCNQDSKNYLHYAVANGCICWVEYLLENGADVNQRDMHQNTPLFYLSPKRPLKITQLLIGSGANVYALNETNQNVAHKIVYECAYAGIEALHEWVLYMHSKGYNRLWGMKNKSLLGEDSQTPLEKLSVTLGTDHAITRFISSNLQYYPDNDPVAVTV